MSRMGRVSIKVKLWGLAGVPVIGALLLASMVIGDSRQQAAKAAAIGSIEDLAQLTGTMTGALHALQTERAATALSEGLEARPVTVSEGGGEARRSTPASVAAAAKRARDRLVEARTATDECLRVLERILTSVDLSRLPPRLGRDLAAARARLGGLGAFRVHLDADPVAIDDVLKPLSDVDASLIRAAAGMSELTDDGELLRNIQSLVAVLELEERASRQHALLAHTFASTQFAPGAFKTFVTLTTEEQIYREVFTTNASESALSLYSASLSDPRVKRADEMRRVALESTDDSLIVDYDAWSEAQQGRIDQLVTIEHEAMNGMKRAASTKVVATQKTVRNSVGLSVVVLALSAALALVIMRGISRSLEDLGLAAARVRQTRDYATRARKTTDDELGVLTDAFNEMLAGIQARDEELEHHRKNLEALVAARTSELGKRNEAMRLVLDNVEQALVTVRADGTMESERSAAFERIFGCPASHQHFADRIADNDPRTREFLRMTWEAAVEDLMPLELILDQMPKSLHREGRHLTIDVKPIAPDGTFGGALMMITDVTAAVEARREQESQREYVKVFERVMRDRAGTIEFVAETGRLVDAVVGRTKTDLALVMRDVHTIKGNAAIWDVVSVAKVAHELETFVVDEQALPGGEQIAALSAVWKRFAARAAELLEATTSATRAEVSRDEIEAILVEVRKIDNHDALERTIDRLGHEPTQVRFERVKVQAETLARKLHKPTPTVVIDAAGVRLPAPRFAPFWQSLIHVVRNTMDHGIEAPEAREAAGKQPSGTLTLRSRVTADELSIEVGDDGAGIDWDRVRAKAGAMGLPAKTRRDLEQALLSSGFSTAEKVTEISGRGVGLGATLGECQRLGGRVEIVTEIRRGTTFRFLFPRRKNELSRPASAAA